MLAESIRQQGVFSMVHLKEFMSCAKNTNVKFNSFMAQLKDIISADPTELSLYFNSFMVQLKAFNFHIPIVGLFISIPSWYN